MTIPYSPTFLAAGRDGNVKRDLVAGRDGPGRVQEGGQVPAERQGRQGGDNFETRSRRSPTTTSSRSCSRSKTSRSTPSPSTRAAACSPRSCSRLRPGAPARRAVRVVRRRAAAAGRGWGRSAAFGALARARRVEGSEPARHLRRRRRDRRGRGRARRDRRLPARTRDRYRKLGGRIPRGVLLAGPPGTGKTLLARAVAGEAGVPFFSIVGLGVRRGDRRRRRLARARPLQAGQGGRAGDHLHRRARRDRPQPRGRRRLSGGNDEREQTLNQILTEMDGFESDAAVIVLAATNRPEVLDPALLRPGRFDRRVLVPPPDKDGRTQDPRGPHALGAAGRRRRPRPARRHHARHGRRRPRQPRQRGRAARRPARARAGHDGRLHRRPREDRARRAARASCSPSEDRRRDGLPRGGPRARGDAHPGRRPGAQGLDHPARDGARRDALGARSSTASTTTRATCGARSRSPSAAAWPRRSSSAAITTGAESDIQQLTEIARGMVGRWGMSEAVGPIAVLPSRRRRARCCRAPPRPRRPRSGSSTRRCGASWTRRTPTSPGC